jgi:beta-mannosidase
MRVDLDGDWTLAYFPEGKLQDAHPDELMREGIVRLPARVPGNVELDLQRAGIIPDPFYADNIRRLLPLELCEWWYTREFDVPPFPPGERWELVFAGLDTFATVWINAVEVGRSANMLVEHRFDATDALRPGPNRIAVRLQSPLLQAGRRRYDASARSWEQREEGLFIRKAPHVWGWDIMPRAVSAGIWRSVWLEQRAPMAFEQLYYWTWQLGSDGATLGARFQFRTDVPVADGFSIRFRGVCREHAFEFEHPVEFIAGGCRIPVPGARLWWPRGYGEPDLYTVTATLCRDGEPLAERTDRIGVRTIVVDRTDSAAPAPAQRSAAPETARWDVPPEPAHHFVVYVNGVPVMVKGTNWVPLDAFHSRDAQRVDKALALAEDLDCNMIRCWGGNVYEDHRFFDLCDEKGIMVWQDFAFACCIYPQTDEFLKEVEAEAEAVVTKLRNHPSLALWCGDNEVDMFHGYQGLDPQGNRLTRETLPRVLYRCDPHRHYVPSSPYVPPRVAGDREAFYGAPEQHLWGPRGYFKAPFYTAHAAHFIGETGYHGCPNVSSVKQFISPARLWPWQDNDEWEMHSVYHFRYGPIRRYRIRLMANQVKELFGEEPGDLETFALASQITQAEAVKFLIESTRLRKWRTSGILWWNVLDGWPQFSDAVVDYYFGKKLAYYYIRRVQQPVCLIVGEPDGQGHMPLVVSNDTREAARVAYSVREADGGRALAEGSVEAPANENWQVARLECTAEARLLLLTWEVDGEPYGNHYVAFDLPAAYSAEAAAAAKAGGRGAGQPLSLERYRAWLPTIAALPRPFNAETIGR